LLSEGNAVSVQLNGETGTVGGSGVRLQAYGGCSSQCKDQDFAESAPPSPLGRTRRAPLLTASHIFSPMQILPEAGIAAHKARANFAALGLPSQNQ